MNLKNETQEAQIVQSYPPSPYPYGWYPPHSVAEEEVNLDRKSVV